MYWQCERSHVENINSGNKLTARNGPTAEMMNAIVQLQYFLKEADQDGNLATDT